MTECNEERKAIDRFGNECSNYFGSGAYNCSDCWLYDYCVGGSVNVVDECKATFDKCHCKSCEYYNDCFYNECAAEAEWEMQQQYMNGEIKQYNLDSTYESEIISDIDVPF